MLGFKSCLDDKINMINLVVCYLNAHVVKESKTMYRVAKRVVSFL